MRRYIVVTLCLLCVALGAQAQRISIVSGYVMNSAVGPLANCLVTEVDAQGRTINSCRTNEGGLFTLPIRDQKRNEIQVVCEGYATMRMPIDRAIVKVFLESAVVKQMPPEGEAVDLGLSVRWSDRNVGAQSVLDAGCFYSWGEVTTKDNYFWTDVNANKQDIYDTQYDPAQVHWGRRWSMPTHNEIDELVHRCVWRWTVCEGVHGFQVTGPSGKSIFLPAGGYRNQFDLLAEGEQGNYWGGCIFNDKQECADALEVRPTQIYHGFRNRGLGMNVRPVWR